MQESELRKYFHQVFIIGTRQKLETRQDELRESLMNINQSLETQDQDYIRYLKTKYLAISDIIKYLNDFKE